MRIGIDARRLADESPAGIANYLRSILLEFEKIEDDNQYFLFSNKPFARFHDFDSRFHFETIWGKFNRIGTLWLTADVQKRLLDYNLDAFWGPEHALPTALFPGKSERDKSHRMKMVLTIHDLALMIHPSWGKLNNTLIQNTFVKRLLKSGRADQILAVSEGTKRDLMKYFHVDENKITVTYSAPNFKSENISGGIAAEQMDKAGGISRQIAELLRPGSRYFLFVGTLEPRKNVENLVKAFSLYRRKREENKDEKNGSGKENPFKLVLAGKNGWKCKKILEAVENSDYKKDIVLTGYISDGEKAALFSGADLFLYPSRYEGFGVPVIEAISYSLPVITADNSSLPEVGGPDSFYVRNTEDIQELAAMIEKVENMRRTNPDELARRIKASREYIKKFTWEKTAELTYQALTAAGK